MFCFRYVEIRKIAAISQRLQSPTALKSHAIYAITAPGRRTFGPSVTRHAAQFGQARWVGHQEPRDAYHGSHCEVRSYLLVLILLHV